MDQLELARKAGLLEPEKPIQKRSGLEIARDALALSHPGSPQLRYLDAMILKAQTINAINQRKETNMSDDTTVGETSAPVEETPTPTVGSTTQS